jgi:hypothetical protein
MTSTNINPVAQAVYNFKKLDVDERLGILGLLYPKVSQAISADNIQSLQTQNATNLVSQIQQLSSEEQTLALRDLLSVVSNNPDEIILDPHPSKAMVELAKGGTKVSTGDYAALNPESRLAFWYLLAQRLGSGINNISRDYQPSRQAKEVLSNVQSLNTNELVSFLQAVLQPRVQEG